MENKWDERSPPSYAPHICKWTCKQECIPVGCIPSAHYRRGYLPNRDPLLDKDAPRQRPPWTDIPLGQRPPGQSPPPRQTPLYKDTPVQRHPWTKRPPWTKTSWTETPLDRDPLDRDNSLPVNRMTDRCKNITLPQTSFTGGNYEPVGHTPDTPLHAKS